MPESFGPGQNQGSANLQVTSAVTSGTPTLLVETRVSPGLGVWLRDLIISLAISAFIIIFIYQPVKVEGTSMMPSLEDQERILVNKFVYRLEAIERGDIVVFRYPRDPSKSYIKRVIGVAGDRIRIDGGQVKEGNAANQLQRNDGRDQPPIRPHVLAQQPDQHLNTFA